MRSPFRLHIFPVLLGLFCSPFLVGFIEINIGDNNQVNTGTISTGDCLDGNNKTETESRRIKTFSSMVLAGSAFDVTIKQGDEQSLTLTADANLLPHITTEVAAEELTIGTERSLCTRNPMAIEIATPELHAVTASGANTIAIRGDYPDLAVSLNGASELTIKGRTKTLKADLQGSTILKAAECRASSVTIEAYGASSAEVHAVDSLTVRSHGASDVTYSGNPAKMDVKTSGAGTISSR